MKRDHEEKKPSMDKHLDIPAESNREKHINFLEVEEESEGKSKTQKDEETNERRKEWQQGLEEGRNNSDRHSSD